MSWTAALFHLSWGGQSVAPVLRLLGWVGFPGRKLEIVQYARQARQLLIRLLALVKWAKNSDPVSKCAVSGRGHIRCEMDGTHHPFRILVLQEVSGQLRHQSWVYVDSADQLVDLARNTLQKAV